jgi:amino acid transporter
MSESPVNTESEKEPKTFTAGASASDDTEAADHGILVKSNPLARELKGRHMQMIAIGMYLHVLPQQLESSLTSNY